LYVPLAELYLRWKNLCSTQRKANWNCNPLSPCHHILFSFSSSPRSSNVPLALTVSKWNPVCIFNFSGSFLLHHLSHSLSVHLPPTFTQQLQSSSCSLCNFFHPTSTPSAFRSSISLSPCSNALFLCLVFGTQTQTQTHNRTNFSVTDILHSQPRHAVWNLCNFMKSCIRYAVL